MVQVIETVATFGMFLPDRLPSLIVLVGFWIPPSVAGAAAAWLVYNNRKRDRGAIFAALAILVLVYAAAWFLFNLGRMPPYIPGSTIDPTFAPPKAVAGLAVVTVALVLPGSALACALAFHLCRRMLRRTLNSGSA